MFVEIQKLTLEQKWQTAESDLIYFVVCGISYAKSRGETAEDLGTWAGEVAAPSWERRKNQGPRGLVEGIAKNKQQFRNFEIEILNESAMSIQAKIRGFGEDLVRQRPRHEITVEDYIRFFDKKWIAIADYLGLEYKQHVEGDWVIFTVTEKSNRRLP